MKDYKNESDYEIFYGYLNLLSRLDDVASKDLAYSCDEYSNELLRRRILNKKLRLNIKCLLKELHLFYAVEKAIRTFTQEYVEREIEYEKDSDSDALNIKSLREIIEDYIYAKNLKESFDIIQFEQPCIPLGGEVPLPDSNIIKLFEEEEKASSESEKWNNETSPFSLFEELVALKRFDPQTMSMSEIERKVNLKIKIKENLH
jgi:hypothetical protein